MTEALPIPSQDPIPSSSGVRRMSTRYPVEVIRSDRRTKTVSARIVEGVIRVRIPSWMSSKEEAKFVGNIVERIERKRRSCAVDLLVRSQSLADKYGLPHPSSITWSQVQRQRWGSCSTDRGDIRISDRLIDVPPWVLDHVLIHELAHLVIPHHGPDFDAIVNRNPRAERAIGYLMAVNDQANQAQQN